jgi:hypothetical protein
MSMKRCGFYSTYLEGRGGTAISQCNSTEGDARGCLYKAMRGDKNK